MISGDYCGRDGSSKRGGPTLKSTGLNYTIPWRDIYRLPEDGIHSGFAGLGKKVSKIHLYLKSITVCQNICRSVCIVSVSLDTF